jgi:hypothetical protein
MPSLLAVAHALQKSGPLVTNFVKMPADPALVILLLLLLLLVLVIVIRSFPSPERIKIKIKIKIVAGHYWLTTRIRCRISSSISPGWDTVRAISSRSNSR